MAGLRLLDRLVASLRLPAAPALAAAGRRLCAGAALQPPQDVHITEACARRLLELSRETASSPDGTVLRVAVDGGGCSGFQYRFELGSASREDRVFERDGARVAVDPVSFGFLRGATVDYSEELIRAAFLVRDNPNTEAACGCGTSFSVKDRGT